MQKFRDLIILRYGGKVKIPANNCLLGPNEKPCYDRDGLLKQEILKIKRNTECTE